jgi:small redox-active disulfide protein 2
MLHIKVVGSGCANCIKLAQLCEEAITENHLEADVEKVTDIKQFADLGVFMTPGLVVNGKVLSTGKIPTKSTLTHWLKDSLN